MTDKAIEAAARAVARSKCDALMHSEIQRGLYEDKRWHDYLETTQTAISAYLAQLEADGFVLTKTADLEELVMRDCWKIQGMNTVQARIHAQARVREYVIAARPQVKP